MPIWSFTQERLDRLKDQILRKKEERDALAALSEKDLWCKDLDDFEAEWENQLRLDAEITTGIRRMGRRTSKKIGAGRGRKPKAADDDYAPVAKSRPGPKAAAKPKEPPKEKSVARFAAMFNGGSKKTGLDGAGDSDDDDPFSDNDFSKLKNPVKKDDVKKEADESDEEVRPVSRSKRAAAAKPKAWIVDDDDSEFDDDKMLDVDDLVKGITNGNASSSENKTGRLSLFSMSRPESSSGNSASLKVKSKPSKVVDLDDHDDTNYEMLAKSSPHKSARGELDSFLSDDDLPPVSKISSKLKSSNPPPEEPKAKAAVKEPATKSRRGRPAVAKEKPKEDKPAKKAATSRAASKAAPKATTLSPLAKVYAAKKEKEKAKPKRDIFDMDDDDDDDLEMADPDSPPPRPVARSRPGRAAAAKAKSKPVYIIDDDDEEDELELDLPNDDEEEQSDDFAMDDSE